MRTLDITTEKLPSNAFDLVLARMLLLHLPDPAAACRQLLATARSDATVVVQDADFSAVALDDASALEADGLRTMTDTMRTSGVDVALGPKLPAMLDAAGADVVTIRPSPGHGNGLAARIVAITIERFRPRAISNGTKSAAIDAAISALRDPNHSFTGPTQWIVCAPDEQANAQPPLRNLTTLDQHRSRSCFPPARASRTSRSRRSPGTTRSGQPTAFLAAPLSMRPPRAE